MNPTHKKHLKALLLVAGVLGLMLAAGSYVLPSKETVHGVQRESKTGGETLQNVKGATGHPLLRPSDHVAAAQSWHSPVSRAKTVSLSRNVVVRAVELERRQALRAYHEAVQCREYVQAKHAVSVITEKMIPLIESAREANGYSRRLQELGEILRTSRDGCEGMRLEDIDKDFFEITLRAALDGDLGAQSCFVQFGGRNQFEIPARKAQYFTYAPRFMEHGVEAGYWPVVWNAVMRLDATWIDNVPQLMDLPKSDPQRVYRALRLRYYRSEPKSAVRLETTMQSLAERYHLSPQQLEQADRWAQQEYSARFANTPLVSPGRLKFCR